MSEISEEIKEKMKDEELKKEIEEMEWSYTNHTPTKEQIKKITALRKAFKYVGKFIIIFLPKGRHKNIVKTLLEDALSRAVKSIILDSEEE